MIDIRNKEAILWDFDGVLIDSMQIREKGFREVLADYPLTQVEKLIEYHKENGGLSRYVKFRLFLEEIAAEKNNIEKKVERFSREYSHIMRKSLTSRELLIRDSLDFIRSRYRRQKMHIVSGSDGEELRFLCDILEIDKYFISIEGSPTPKIEVVKNLLLKYRYEEEKTCLIGDSINDFEAARENAIDFYGFNNIKLKDKGRSYISSFKNIFASEN